MVLVLPIVALLGPPGPTQGPGGFFEALGLEKSSAGPKWDWLNLDRGAFSIGVLPPLGAASAPSWSLGDRPGFDAVPPLAREGEGAARPAGQAALIADPGRWYFRQDLDAGGLYRRRSRLEIPAPGEIDLPYAGRQWSAQERVQIPVPIPLPAAEQLFVYTQFDTSGDALGNLPTSVAGRTGVGLKWSLLAGSEVQVRYMTMFSYVNQASVGRYQERTQPAFEVLARLPILGPLELEYTGTALPAVSRTEPDQIRQELRLAWPLQGDSELEVGARYRWDLTPDSPSWIDRAQLFIGVRVRR